jgi:hypothetical protein
VEGFEHGPGGGAVSGADAEPGQVHDWFEDVAAGMVSGTTSTRTASTPTASGTRSATTASGSPPTTGSP